MAEMNAEAAMEMGVSRDRMILFNKPESTHDEAVYLNKMIRKKPFILVTSALHMKRAMLIFESYGMNPVPAPVDYMVKQVKGKTFFYYLPSIHSIQIMEDYLHEQVGILWFKLQMLKTKK